MKMLGIGNAIVDVICKVDDSFISKNNLSFFQGCVIKYVCRYMHKNGVEDLDKIIHYCELEKKKLQDATPEQLENWVDGYRKWKAESEDNI